MRLQVTPNGPWGKDLHPVLPISLAELAADLRACIDAGADGVHLHVRNRKGDESFDPGDVADSVSAAKDAAGGRELEIGLTTGAWVVPDVEERIARIREWEGVDCATVNLCEAGFERVMAAMLERGIGIDVGLWDESEIDRLVASGLLPHAQRVSIELDTGEPYKNTGDPIRLCRGIETRLARERWHGPLLIHGAGEWMWPLVRHAIAEGHATRVGFEDSTLLEDGRTAQDNAELVRAAMRITATETRATGTQRADDNPS